MSDAVPGTSAWTQPEEDGKTSWNIHHYGRNSLRMSNCTYRTETRLVLDKGPVGGISSWLKRFEWKMNAFSDLFTFSGLLTTWSVNVWIVLATYHSSGSLRTGHPSVRSIKVRKKGIPLCSVVRTLCFHCRGCRFDFWSRNWNSTSHARCGPKSENKDPLRQR